MGLSFSKIKTDKELRASTSLSTTKFNQLSVLFSSTYCKIYGVSIQESQGVRKFAVPPTKQPF